VQRADLQTCRGLRCVGSGDSRERAARRGCRCSNASTFVTIPSNDATVSGISQILDAGASSGVTQLQYEITGGTLTDSIVATGTPTIYGWLAKWNTTTLANGTYNLQSVATSNGASGTSAPVTITVNNPPPSTSVIIPTSGATMDTTKGVVWDAVASPGVTSVSFVSTANGVTGTNAAIPTIYGWVYIVSTPSQPCNGCIPYRIPISIQSVASFSGGVSGTSQPIAATLVLYLPADIA
jgi:hypothetical protein